MPYHDTEHLATPPSNGLPIGLDRWLVCTATLASIPHNFATRRINHRSIARRNR